MLLAFAFTAGASARAQLVEDWRARIDVYPAAPDVGQVCAAGPGGELYVAGHTLPPLAQWYDTQLVRLDPNGGVVWSRTWPGDLADDTARAIAVDPASGNVIVALHRMIDHPTNDATIVAWDPNGNVVWSFVYDGAAHDRDFVGGQRIVLDAAGNVYVPLTSTGTTGTTSSGFDVVLLSLAPDGTPRWEQRYDGAAHVNDSAIDVAIDGARVVVCGHADQGGGAIGKLLVRAFQLDGAPLWTRSFAAPGIATMADQVVLDPSGNAYVAGRTLDGFLYMDAWLWSFDTAGNTRWGHALGTNGLVGRSFLRLDALGDLVLAGTDQAETNDVFVVAHDLDGNQLWSATWDGMGAEDTATAFALDAGGQSVLAVSNGAPDRFHLLAWSRQGTPTESRAVVTGSSTWVGNAESIAPTATLLCGAAAANGTPAEELFVLRVHTPFEVFCAGDGTEGACPCGNASPLHEQRGCAHSIGPGARLLASGAPSLASDALQLSTTGLPGTTTAILLQGDVRIAPIPFGDGLRCVGGTLRRLYTRAASAGALALPQAGDPSISTRAQALGDPLAPGATRCYQLYFRNASTTFCPPETFNATNAVAVEWGA